MNNYDTPERSYSQEHNNKRNSFRLIISICAFTLIALIVYSLCCDKAKAQSPKQHVFYDTVKTVKERVDFSPDTIPVYFEELVMPKDTSDEYGIPYTQWKRGYVIWQTYVKDSLSTGNISWSYGSGIMSNNTGYYKTEFEPTLIDTRHFLYSDRKTKVTNKVIFSIKR